MIDRNNQGPTYLRFAAIILAAGSSTRYNGNKLEMKINNISVLEWATSPFVKVENFIQKIILVAGEQFDTYISMFEDIEKVEVKYNKFHKNGGMASSIRCGIQSIDIEEFDGIFIHLGDIPTIIQNDVMIMINEFSNLKKGIISISHNKKRGHPVLFHQKFADVLCELDKYEKGLRGFLQIHVNEILEVETTNEGILLDLDRDSDFTEIRELLDKRS